MKLRYVIRLKVCCTDIDFLLHRMQTNDLYKERQGFDYLDLSDYDQSRFLHEEVNKLLFLMSDELQGSQGFPMKFCLESKPYGIQFDAGVKQRPKKSSKK